MHHERKLAEEQQQKKNPLQHRRSEMTPFVLRRSPLILLCRSCFGEPRFQPQSTSWPSTALRSGPVVAFQR